MTLSVRAVSFLIWVISSVVSSLEKNFSSEGLTLSDKTFLK